MCANFVYTKNKNSGFMGWKCVTQHDVRNKNSFLRAKIKEEKNKHIKQELLKALHM